MKDKSSRNIRLAYKVLDYLNGELDQEPLGDFRHIEAIAKIIDGFDGREAVLLRHSHPHEGYLRLVTRKE